jgi:pilus assembly protein Flp/PilA
MMLRLAVWWECLKARQDGQGMTEYGLILALIAVVLILVLTNMGTALKDQFTKICQALGACH